MKELMYIGRRMQGREMPDGIIRMDRAALYVRNKLAEIASDLGAKGTKTVGETGFRIASVGRELISFCRMASDSALIRPAQELMNVGERSPREATIQLILSIASLLESYEDDLRAQEEESLQEQQRLLEDKLGITGDGKPSIRVDDPKAVFVIMPFRAEFNDVWKGGIQSACSDLGLTAVRVDMINRSSNITDDIVESIVNCHVAIADVTENNPNVMFELGYAMAKAKPNIIISQSSDFLPFDIRHLRTIVYANSWSGIEELRKKLTDFLKEVLPHAGSSHRGKSSKSSSRRAAAK